MEISKVVDNPTRQSYEETFGGESVSTCEKCSGAGKVIVAQKTGRGQTSAPQTCGTCGGSGRMITSTVYHYRRFSESDLVVPAPPPSNIGSVGPAEDYEGS